MGIGKADWEKGWNLFKRKSGYVKVWLVMINYWDVGRIVILGIGMDKETRIIGNRKRYTIGRSL